IGAIGHDVVSLTHQQRPVGRDRRQVGSPAARDRPHQPLHRQVHDPHRVSHGGPRQQPTPQRVEPDRGSGEGERDAVDLRALEAVDRGEAGLGAPRDVDAVAGRREGQRPGMIAQRDEGRLAAAQRIHEQHSRVARHREQVAPARRGDVAATRWGDLLAVSSDSGVLLMDPLGRREPAFVALSDHPRALAFSPSGHRIYVTRRTEPGLAAIDRFERAEIDGIALPLPAAAIRLDPLGRWLLARPTVPGLAASAPSERAETDGTAPPLPAAAIRLAPLGRGLLARPTVGDSVWVVDLPVKRLVGAVASGWRADLPAIAPDGSLLVRQGDDLVAYRPDSLVETGRLKGAAADLWTLSPWRPRGGYRGAFADAQAAAGQPGSQGGGAADTAGAPGRPPYLLVPPAPDQAGPSGKGAPPTPA